MLTDIKLKRIQYILLLTLTFIIGCNGGKMEEQLVDYDSLKEVPVAAWEKLSKKNIYFGHQSVGNNIISGLKDIMKENLQVKLNIIEFKDRDDYEGKKGIWGHSKVGSNMDPQSKIEDFVKIMDDGLGNNADIAFFKFCYVDIKKDTKLNQVFSEYQKAMSTLKGRYPNTKFIHVTVPLTVVQTGPRVWVKKIIGRPLGGYDDNIKRNEYNSILINQYKNKEKVFDLAAVESTYKDARQNKFRSGDNDFLALIPGYASDGRHLNEEGRKHVAKELLLFLISII